MSEQLDTPFVTRDTGPLHADIYRPTGEKQLHTAALLFHGGGWRRGSRKAIAHHAKYLAAQGFTAISCQYRLLDEAPWPAQLFDVREAIRWTRANAADLDIDPAKITLVGFSAGAHLALIAAGTSGNGLFPDEGAPWDVAAVVALYPSATFHVGETRHRGSLPATALLGENPSLEDARLASPVTHIHPAFPPTLLFHGTADKIAPVSASMVLYDALKDAGVPADLQLFAGLGHAFDYIEAFQETVQPAISVFLRRFVADREQINQQIRDRELAMQAARQPVPVAGGAS